MLSVITLKDLITAHAALDTLEMEHHATVIFSFTFIVFYSHRFELTVG